MIYGSDWNKAWKKHGTEIMKNCTTKHFEFVPGDTIEIEPGKILQRIRAITHIEIHNIKPGDLGGYIESSKNLDGNAWVFNNAWVYGNARVYGNAIVSGAAQVFGNALVCGDALICDNARVYGNAQVFGNAQISGNAGVYSGAQVFGNALVSGNAGVYGGAQVFGNALVSGDAQIFDNAQVFNRANVYGNAWVFGNAIVCGNSRVFGDVSVCGDALINEDGLIFWASKVGSENGTFTAYNTASGGIEVTRGCFRGSIEEFLAASRAKHDDVIHNEYRLLCEVAISRINRARERQKESKEQK